MRDQAPAGADTVGPGAVEVKRYKDNPFVGSPQA
jgi:hypothetical protein